MPVVAVAQGPVTVVADGVVTYEYCFVVKMLVKPQAGKLDFKAQKLNQERTYHSACSRADC